MISDQLFPYKTAIIYGLGRSGQAAKQLLDQAGVAVIIFDDKSVGDVLPLNQLVALYKQSAGPLGPVRNTEKLDPRFRGEGRIRDDIALILSPGIPRTKRLVQQCIKHNIPILNEIELAAYFVPDCRWIGVTGTNGKSTVVSLIGEMLQSWDPAAFVGGNLGRPLCEAIAEGERPKKGVLELSSYQLETIRTLKLSVAAITNLAPDHLDRYESVEDYYEAKRRIFGLVKGSREAEQQRNREIGMKNTALAIQLATDFGVPPEHIEAGIKNFKGLPHRMEHLGEKSGIFYINDSKATNIAATNMAISSVDKPIHLILGGKAKGLDWGELISPPSMGGNLIIYAIGETTDEIYGYFSSQVLTHKCKTLENAIQLARSHAKSGDCILLSPACASFDQFRNFEARGDVFRKIVG